MKAIITTQYGSPDVLQLQEVAKPIPTDQEVLIKIHASSVTAADVMMRRGTPFYGRLFLGLTKPKRQIAGTGLAGIIEAIGKDVKSFKIGDAVFGESGLGPGTNAEYVCVPETGVIALKPNNISFEEAATISDGPLTSINFLQEVANLQPGQSVLINGASGSLGTAAVQLAKHVGAVVTGVCSTKNLDLVKSLGADQVIDYTVNDFITNGQTYDIIYDTVGKLSFSVCKNSLKENGAYISPVLGLPLLFQMLRTSIIGGKKAKFSATGLRPAPELRILLQELNKIIETGKLKFIIDKRYSLEGVVEAHRYVDSGRKRGNVVVSM